MYSHRLHYKVVSMLADSKKCFNLLLECLTAGPKKPFICVPTDELLRA